MKTIVGKNNEMYYRISVREEVDVKRYKETVFYRLKMKDGTRGGEKGSKVLG